MAFFGRGDDEGPGPYMDLRIAIFFVGAAVGVFGMVTDTDWLVGVAIAVLVLGFLLRFAGRDA